MIQSHQLVSFGVVSFLIFFAILLLLVHLKFLISLIESPFSKQASFEVLSSYYSCVASEYSTVAPVTFRSIRKRENVGISAGIFSSTNRSSISKQIEKLKAKIHSEPDNQSQYESEIEELSKQKAHIDFLIRCEMNLLLQSNQNP